MSLSKSKSKSKTRSLSEDQKMFKKLFEKNKERVGNRNAKRKIYSVANRVSKGFMLNRAQEDKIKLRCSQSIKRNGKIIGENRPCCTFCDKIKTLGVRHGDKICEPCPDEYLNYDVKKFVATGNSAKCMAAKYFQDRKERMKLCSGENEDETQMRTGKARGKRKRTRRKRTRRKRTRRKRTRRKRTRRKRTRRKRKSR